jgi:hypothetical protein
MLVFAQTQDKRGILAMQISMQFVYKLGVAVLAGAIVAAAAANALPLLIK